MIQWLKQQLPRARRARQRAAIEAQIAYDQQIAELDAQMEHTRALAETDHQAWLATLPDALRAHPQLRTRDAQREARRWASLTPPSDCPHAIERHFRWMAPPELPTDTTLATKIVLLMTKAPNAEGTCYHPNDLVPSFDGAFDATSLSRFIAGTTPEISLDTLFQLQRFYQTWPLYFLPVFFLRSNWMMTMFGSGRVRVEGMVRKLVGDVYTDPLVDLSIAKSIDSVDIDLPLS